MGNIIKFIILVKFFNCFMNDDSNSFSVFSINVVSINVGNIIRQFIGLVCMFSNYVMVKKV